MPSRSQPENPLRDSMQSDLLLEFSKNAHSLSIGQIWEAESAAIPSRFWTKRTSGHIVASFERSFGPWIPRKLYDLPKRIRLAKREIPPQNPVEVRNISQSLDIGSTRTLSFSNRYKDAWIEVASWFVIFSRDFETGWESECLTMAQLSVPSSVSTEKREGGDKSDIVQHFNTSSENLFHGLYVQVYILRGS